MRTRENQLRSCPFCGAREYEKGRRQLAVASDRNGSSAVFCLCGATGPIKNTAEEARNAWNNRSFSTESFSWNPFSLPIHPACPEMEDLKGNLKSIGFPVILQILSSEGKTGTLQFVSGKDRRAICLKDGKIIAASGLGGVRLGQLLFAKGLISEAKLSEVLQKARESGKRVGDVLLAMGCVDESTLKDLIRHQVREIVFDLLFWGEGEFEYHDCEVYFDTRAVEEISTTEVMLEAAVRKDEEVAVQRV
ncbi:MAG: DUF4388 domain-containing protein [Deltaproteobacteria bacterium]|nr:DUF4388 domain-containing protein [Deltaproteobacteria bacterium]MBW2071383.1 DUF4388 domain-containing protein [Deltaproteobacteria bacterium]